MDNGPETRVPTPPPRSGSSPEGSPSSGFFHRNYGAGAGSKFDFNRDPAFDRLLESISERVGSRVSGIDPRTASDRNHEARLAGTRAVEAGDRLVSRARTWPSTSEGVRVDARRAWGRQFDDAFEGTLQGIAALTVAEFPGERGIERLTVLEFFGFVAAAMGHEAAVRVGSVDEGLFEDLRLVEARLAEVEHAKGGELIAGAYADRLAASIERLAISTGVRLPRSWSTPVSLADLARLESIAVQPRTLATKATTRGAVVELFRGALWADLEDLQRCRVVGDVDLEELSKI